MVNGKGKMTSDELCERLFRFAEMVIDIANALPKTPAGFAVGKQFVKAGTSIGANYEEAQGAFSKKDFRYKIATCLKESRETHFWLRLIYSKLLPQNELVKAAGQEAKEFKAIFGKMLKTSRQE